MLPSLLPGLAELPHFLDFPLCDFKGLSRIAGNWWQIIFLIFRAISQALFQELWCDDPGASGVILGALIPNTPHPINERFAFLARGLPHYFCKGLSYL
jgi:hypothetical protein